MPGDSEHPVTLGDLRVAKAVIVKEGGEWPNEVLFALADAFEAEHRYRADPENYVGTRLALNEVLDALAEAQPFPPAGGVP